MNRDLGIWSYEECALVLIDFQKEMFETIRSETGPDLVDLHVRLLAKNKGLLQAITTDLVCDSGLQSGALPRSSTK